MTIELECDVYKSTKKENLYLYVTSNEGLERVPQELLSQFGEPEKTLTFILTSNRSLAKEDPRMVLENIEKQGYHLQLPPAHDRAGGTPNGGFDG